MLQTFSGNITRYGLVGGVGKSFSENKLSTNLKAIYNRQQLDGESAGYVITGSLSVGYNLHKNHKLSANLRLTKNETKNQTFSENIANLEYIFRIN